MTPEIEREAMAYAKVFIGCRDIKKKEKITGDKARCIRLILPSAKIVSLALVACQRKISLLEDEANAWRRVFQIIKVQNREREVL